jgi:hypothetical protein
MNSKKAHLLHKTYRELAQGVVDCEHPSPKCKKKKKKKKKTPKTPKTYLPKSALAGLPATKALLQAWVFLALAQLSLIK